MRAIIIALILALFNNLTVVPADVMTATDGYAEFNDGSDIWGYYFEDQPTPAVGQHVLLVMDTQGTADVMDDTIEMIIID